MIGRTTEIFHYPFRLLIFSFLILFCFSCDSQKKEEHSNTFAPEQKIANGYVVPKDSVSDPVVHPAIQPSSIPAGIAKVIPANINIHPAGSPSIHTAGTPRICTPGQDTFSLPRTVAAIVRQVSAGLPEVVVAKDAYTKDQNPANFSSFGKLQGLKHDVIRCMIQDRTGNIWLGTYGGGVTKYDGKSFTHFTEKEGLINNTVLAMLQDQKGNIWFCTSDGVSKYDGKTFTQFTEEEGLSSNTVWSIMEDRKGNLWFGTDEGGVSCYDGKSFTHFTTKEGLSNNTVWSILEDKNGTIWFGTDAGVNKFDGKSFTHFTKEEGLSNNNILEIYEDKRGNLWFGTNGGVCQYDKKNFTCYTENEGLGNNGVRDILEDKYGIFWFCTDIGISKFDGHSFTHFKESEGLSNVTVWSVLEDNSGNLWFGTDEEVCKYDGKIFTHITEKEGLSNNTVWSILEDRRGNLWLGTYDGGAVRYDGQSFTVFTTKEGLCNNNVLAILEDKNGMLWFGTNEGVSQYDGKTFRHFTTKEGLSGNNVRCMLEDKNGNIWFGTFGDGVSKYDGKNFTQFTEKEGLSSNNVLTIFEDKHGNIWFGTYDGGLSRYDGKTFTHFTVKEGLSNNTVRCILEDENGDLWFGTYGGGVNKYDGKTFTQFTEKEGLCNNTVLAMFEDSKGNLWFGTRFGLSKLAPESRKKLTLYGDSNEQQNQSVADAAGNVFFKNYTFEDGFLGIGVNGGQTIYEDKNGTIWIAANDRLTAYYYNGDEADTKAPHIELTGVGLFNSQLAWLNLASHKDTSVVLGNGVRVGDFEFDGISNWYSLPENLSLAYNNNFLTFDFIGITQKQSKKVKYQYKLEGLDENWSAITNRTEAPYGNLPQGEYIFKVKAMNSEGIWSPALEYRFTIRPPWWKTWWMYTIYVLSFILAFVFYVKWRERKLKKENIILEQKVDDATKVIRAEKEKSDTLLLNILPQEVAEELKETGTANAKQFNNVTVLFTDFVGFTRISQQMSAKELVAEIHKNFSAFDRIIEKHGLEKIKTIGDAYMAVCGLPHESADHAERVVKAALEIRDYIAECKGVFGIRIGVHSGAVVAGIVGVKKYAYDIWGDTVNTASRMESNGEAGKVNISGFTYEQIKNKFRFENRGKVNVKGKGEIEMYFVDWKN